MSRIKIRSDVFVADSIEDRQKESVTTTETKIKYDQVTSHDHFGRPLSVDPRADRLALIWMGGKAKSRRTLFPAQTLAMR
jgi:hypothetical protein